MADTEQLRDGDLLNMLGEVVDRGGPRGTVYGLVFVLAASLVAVLAGAKNLQEIAGHVADFPHRCCVGWVAYGVGFSGSSARRARTQFVIL
ncbi:MAG TPA: hypothetical protein VG756_26640 [Pseudonocardiaceae bacterium]|nr:hypothetical protein [Pseudonocardiaceae bacterium]